MKSIMYLLLFTFALTLAVISCNKDAATKSNKELLTSTQWKIFSRSTNGVAEVFENCEKDNYVIFSSNGTFTYNPGTLKCFADEVATNGSWSLSSDEKKITLSSTGQISEGIIVELTESKFVASGGTGSSAWVETYVAF